MIDRERDESWPGRDDADAFDGLNESIAAPDFTGRVMERMGFERVDHRAARQARLRRFTNRFSACVCIVAAAALGVILHGFSDRARTPDPGAVRGAVQADFKSIDHGLRRMGDLWPSIDVHRAASPADCGSDGTDGAGASQSSVPWSGLL